MGKEKKFDEADSTPKPIYRRRSFQVTVVVIALAVLAGISLWRMPIADHILARQALVMQCEWFVGLSQDKSHCPDEADMILTALVENQEALFDACPRSYDSMYQWVMYELDKALRCGRELGVIE